MPKHTEIQAEFLKLKWIQLRTAPKEYPSILRGEFSTCLPGKVYLMPSTL